MIFCKRKELVFDIFTFDENSYRFFNIKKANEFIPDWWKKAPQTYAVNDFVSHSTIKTCTGFIDYYQSGFILPMWSDLAIKIDDGGEYRWQFADNSSVAVSHPHEQWSAYSPNKNVGHLKLTSLWRMRGKDDIKWLLKSPTWNYQPFKKWTIADGMVDYSIIPDLNINVFLDTSSPSLINMSAGDPLCHLIPVTDKKIILKQHLVTKDEWDKLSFRQFAFTNSYRKYADLNKKCPFSK